MSAPGQAPITDMNPSVAEMEARVARFQHLQPTHDYLDAAIPGAERTTLRVVSTTPDAPIAADGFHMNLVLCEPGKCAPLHNHLTTEFFVPLTGRWEVFWGPQGERRVELGAWDTVSIPPGVSRGFRNISDAPAYLMGIASGQDPGEINWPAHIKAAAAKVGVILPGKD
jgi:mannose-6-phosphate isomerase-like protein (cupin superfamily)